MITHHPATPAAMLGGPLQHRELLWALVKRDFVARYKGSVLGAAWSLFTPLLMLAIYTIVFSGALKARWGGGGDSQIAYAIVLFSGMIVHSLFAECLNRAPALVTSYPHYVKKVVFPLDILPWMALLSALLQFLTSFGVLLIFCVAAGVPIRAGTLLIPFILLPLILMIMGLSWFLASLGVYLRDLTQATNMATAAALFMAPVFYPIDALPERYRTLLLWNPITLPVIQLRDLMLWSTPLRWNAWAISLLAGALVCQIGYWWFQRSRRGFADVL
jgi:lipopolysaccharide transport system permease protein